MSSKTSSPRSTQFGNLPLHFRCCSPTRPQVFLPDFRRCRLASFERNRTKTRLKAKEANNGHSVDRSCWPCAALGGRLADDQARLTGGTGPKSRWAAGLFRINGASVFMFGSQNEETSESYWLRRLARTAAQSSGRTGDFPGDGGGILHLATNSLRQIQGLLPRGEAPSFSGRRAPGG